MICPICQKEINEESKFCQKCGNKIPRCPLCNEVIPKKMRFCSKDGTPLPEEIFSAFSKTEDVYENKNIRYCVQCGALCSGEQILCIECQKKNVSNSGEKNIHRKRVGLLIVLLLFIGAMGVLGYFIHNGNKYFESFSRNSVEYEDTNPATNERDVEIKQEKNETEEVLDLPSDENNEIDKTVAPVTEEVIETNNNMPQSEKEQEVNEIDPVEYFILNSDKEYFTKEDILEFDANMCRVARNGIYARMGRKFNDEALANYYLRFDWYMPVIEPDDFSEDMLNVYQIANRDLIVEYEEEQGFR